MARCVADCHHNEVEGQLIDRNSNSSLHHIAKRSSFQKILCTLSAERQKKNSSDDDFVVVSSGSADAFWTAVFSKYFLAPAHRPSGEDSRSHDDLLFFVRDLSVSGEQTRMYGSASNLANSTDAVQVFRTDSKTLPSLGDPAYVWEETVYLNLILQQLEYTLTCAVCSRTGDRELQILKKSSQRVYASPSRRQMESKGTEETIAYPDIFFTVDNFEEAFSDLMVRDSEMVCVELVASDRHGDFQAVIFIGSIRYEALRTAFDSRQSSLSAKMRHSFSWGTHTQQIGGRRTEFIKMRGPQGKGHAEMAISRQKGVPDTPGTTPLVTPSTTPGHSPEKEELPPFPNDHPAGAAAANPMSTSYSADERRYSDASASPFKNGGAKKWKFNIRKSQSASDHVSQLNNDTGEVEAKSISEELHQPGQSLLGRSFGQAWHWFKEQRRAASVGLNSCLTYVTLPWHRIIADVLDNRRSPVLTF